MIVVLFIAKFRRMFREMVVLARSGRFSCPFNLLIRYVKFNLRGLISLRASPVFWPCLILMNDPFTDLWAISLLFLPVAMFFYKATNYRKFFGSSALLQRFCFLRLDGTDQSSISPLWFMIRGELVFRNLMAWKLN